jgi:predicted ATPase
MLQTIFLSFLAEAQQKAGRLEDAVATVDRALTLGQTSGELFYGAELHRLRGELLLMQSDDNRDKARGEFDRAVMLAESQGAASLKDRAAASLDRLNQPTGAGYGKQTA